MNAFTTLSPEKLAIHMSHIGGSNAGVIVAGDPIKCERLRKEKLGLIEREDLSDVLPVQLGIETEAFNKRWYEKVTGRLVEEVDSTIIHKKHKFMCANLDGVTTTLDGRAAVFEAKHVNQFSKPEDVATNYYPQAQHYLEVTGLEVVVFSVLIGTLDYKTFEISRDDRFIEKLIESEKLFWWHVENDMPITDFESIEVQPVAFDAMRKVSMAGNNTWANYATEWIGNRIQAKNFKEAEKELKALVEADVKEAEGYGIKITRAKNGNLTIKEAGP